MNVRFFAGTKGQYRKLDKHNPIGLYFCSDTRELFWGDRLLSDGIRLVKTKIDLPAAEVAADGIIYYVLETKEGYTFDGSLKEWVLVIQAPDDSGKQEIDLSSYYTRLEADSAIKAAIAEIKIPDVSNFITEVPSEYITESELSEKNYATEAFVLDKILENQKHECNHDNVVIDLSDYVTKDEISELASEQYVTEAVQNAKVDISGLATIAQVSAKADNIPFTDDAFVTSAIGDFAVGESVKDLTIKEILAKLLGLRDEIIEPELPSEPEGIIETILFNKLPMYSVTADGELAEVPYKYIALTEDTALVEASEAGFYQIKDALNNVIESGYQELQVNSGDVYYVIALPKEIDYNTMVGVKVWDSLKNCWTDMGVNKLALTNDASTVVAYCDEAGIDISHIDTSMYTVWAMEASPDGSKIRFIINE